MRRPGDKNVDSRLLLLAPEDNVFVARVDLEAGSDLIIDGRAVRLVSPAPLGFKVAREPIKRGEKVIKYGAPVGSATAEIAPGEVVHLDNMKSDYLPTYTLGGTSQFTKEVKE